MRDSVTDKDLIRLDYTKAPIVQYADESECEFCGKWSETRPYGPNREYICFDCAMKDEATTRRIFARDVLGDGETH